MSEHKSAIKVGNFSLCDRSVLNCVPSHNRSALRMAPPKRAKWKLMSWLGENLYKSTKVFKCAPLARVSTPPLSPQHTHATHTPHQSAHGSHTRVCCRCVQVSQAQGAAFLIHERQAYAARMREPPLILTLFVPPPPRGVFPAVGQAARQRKGRYCPMAGESVESKRRRTEGGRLAPIVNSRRISHVIRKPCRQKPYSVDSALIDILNSCVL